MDCEVPHRKRGRPRVITGNMVPEVLCLHRQGLGYRATARELRRRGVQVNWSTVRRLVKAQEDGSFRCDTSANPEESGL